MSITDKSQKTKKIVFFILLFVLFGVLTSCIKQVNSYFYTNRKLREKQKELEALQNKNQALKVRLETVKKPEFLEEQAKKVFGLNIGSPVIFQKPTPIPSIDEKQEEQTREPGNFQKWLELFVY